MRISAPSRPSRILRLVALLAVLVVLLPVLALPAPGARAEGSKGDKIKQRETVDQKLEDLKLSLNDVNADLRTTYLDLAETELLIPTAQDDLEDARRAVSRAEKKDRRIGDRLDDAQDEERRLSKEVDSGNKDIDESDEQLAEVALEAYKGGGLPDPTTVFVGNASPQDAVDRSMNYRLTMSSQGQELKDLRSDQAITVNSADRLTAVRKEIDDLKQQSEDALRQKRKAEKKAEKAKKDLDDLYDQQKRQKKRLERKKTKYQDDQSTLEARRNTLDTEITKLAREEKRKEQAGTTVVHPSRTGYIRPVPGRMNSSFGWRYHPIYHTRKLHAGNDFPVPCGTPVKATASGRVIATTYNHAAGNKLIISHGIHGGKLITSSYHHLSGFHVSAGQNVRQGQVVAYVGTTGSSTGCHLHFEVHEDGTPVDPARYV